MKYKVELVELVEFHTIEIEAESEEDAENEVAVMDDEEIISKSVEHTGLQIWDSMKCVKKMEAMGLEPMTSRV